MPIIAYHKVKVYRCLDHCRLKLTKSPDSLRSSVVRIVSSRTLNRHGNVGYLPGDDSYGIIPFQKVSNNYRKSLLLSFWFDSKYALHPIYLIEYMLF